MVPVVKSWDKRKYPRNPKGKTKINAIEKKSKTLALGIFFFLQKKNNANAPPRIAPVIERPGKYGNSKNPSGLINTGSGFINT